VPTLVMFGCAGVHIAKETQHAKAPKQKDALYAAKTVMLTSETANRNGL